MRMDLQMIIPVAFDWDGDDLVDLIVGDEDGRVAWLRCEDWMIKVDRSSSRPYYFQQRATQVKFGAGDSDGMRLGWRWRSGFALRQYGWIRRLDRKRRARLSAEVRASQKTNGR
ncbi:MAG: hypothetical protein R3B96_08275 [Pirellulaceae bacterium]